MFHWKDDVFAAQFEFRSFLSYERCLEVNLKNMKPLFSDLFYYYFFVRRNIKRLSSLGFPCTIASASHNDFSSLTIWAVNSDPLSFCNICGARNNKKMSKS